MALKVAVVGAQGTGKTSLVSALRARSSAGTAPPDMQVEEAFPLIHAITDGWLTPQDSEIAMAAARHRHYDLTLLLGMDLTLPRAAQRDHVAVMLRPADFDARLRHTLNAHDLPFTVVYGNGQARTDCALQAIAHHVDSFDAATRRHARGTAPTWQWCCDTCSDASCEHRLFSALIKSPSMRT